MSAGVLPTQQNFAGGRQHRCRCRQLRRRCLVGEHLAPQPRSRTQRVSCLAQRDNENPAPPDSVLVTLVGDLWLDLEDALVGDGLSSGALNTGLPDYIAAALWSASLWFVSPLQLLLLFLGKIETERPSDWTMNAMGRAAGLPVKKLGYAHPLAVRAITVLLTVGAGTSVALGLEAGLGDATWGISSGIASCMAAGVYELGRPARLSPEDAEKLEMQWQAFAQFAEERLQRSGGCHESEIVKAFETANPAFRAEAKIEEQDYKTMLSNWYPQAQRTPSGFYKNVSLKSR